MEYIDAVVSEKYEVISTFGCKGKGISVGDIVEVLEKANDNGVFCKKLASSLTGVWLCSNMIKEIKKGGNMLLNKKEVI